MPDLDVTLGWHFVSGPLPGTLRNGDPVPPDGEWLEHDGELVIFDSGLHWSERAIDALYYAPGNIVCRVEVAGETLTDTDKRVSRRRKVLWRADAEAVLRAFARRCALDVAHLWNMPTFVRDYLETGDESKRAAAWDAARAADWDAAGAAAWAAAWDAARAAARAAAWAAAGEAAGAAAWAAAWDAAWAADWDAAGAAAWAAARDAAGAAARDAARDAAGAAARDAAWDAAWAAAWDAQNTMLTEMLEGLKP